MSISKAQAEALADGFIDSIGGGNADALRPKNTLTELFLIAGELAEDAVNNLNKDKKNSSGKLSESIEVEEPQQSGNIVSTEISMNFYGKFVNSGVKGTKSGRSTAGYQFRSDVPSKKMVEAVQKWIKIAARSVRNVKKPVSGLELKRKSVSELNLGRAVAFATARSIVQKGLKPTGFMDKAISKASSKVNNRLSAAFKIDIINSLPD